jgi:esterase/lipase
MIFDYPGFGLSEGYPNEESCLEVSELFYKYLHENKKYSKKNIIFYGESIGGSIATTLSVKTKIKYLILHSTFSNISLIIKQFIYIPSIVLDKIGFNTIDSLKKRYKLNILKINKNINENSDKIENEDNKTLLNKKNKELKLKTLIIHSKEDELIPFFHALEMSKYSTDFYECEGKHSSPKINKEFLEKIIKFIN